MQARIKIRQWLAKEKGVPRVADITRVHRRTAKAVLVDGHGTVEHAVHCMICGRELTHPVSQQVGIGPVCCENVGVPWEADESPEAIAALKERLQHETTFKEVWLPLSQIEDVLEGSLRVDGQAALERQAAKRDFRAKLQERRRKATDVAGCRVRFKVTEWLAKNDDAPWHMDATYTGSVKRETEKGLLVRMQTQRLPDDTVDVGMGSGKDERWLPKSQVVGLEVLERGTEGRLPQRTSRPRPRHPARSGPVTVARKDPETGKRREYTLGELFDPEGKAAGHEPEPLPEYDPENDELKRIAGF